LRQVAKNSAAIVDGFNGSKKIPLNKIHKDTVKTPNEITNLINLAKRKTYGIGKSTWINTFSHAKMWIRGLSIMKKPICHLHTKFNAEIPWSKIDMDFMNLNQSAHGDREFGFMMSRMRKKRKVIVGHWQEERVQEKVGNWCRVVLGWDELQNLKVARIGDNMREVAVTEGDKVAAQMRFGMAVNGYDSSEVVAHINKVSEAEVDKLIEEYESSYDLSEKLQEGGEKRDSLKEADRK